MAKKPAATVAVAVPVKLPARLEDDADYQRENHKLLDLREKEEAVRREMEEIEEAARVKPLTVNDQARELLTTGEMPDVRETPALRYQELERHLAVLRRAIASQAEVVDLLRRQCGNRRLAEMTERGGALDAVRRRSAQLADQLLTVLREESHLVNGLRNEYGIEPPGEITTQIREAVGRIAARPDVR